jgi:hypothetical protein
MAPTLPRKLSLKLPKNVLTSELCSDLSPVFSLVARSSDQQISPPDESTPNYIFGILATVIGMGALCLAFLQLRRTRRACGANVYEMAG